MTHVELVPQDDLGEDYRSGFVAVVGKPNVGKSTLINGYVGQKVAIVSPKPQTTRRRLRGIVTLPMAQIVFVDTPGVHEPRHKLGEYMVETAARALSPSPLANYLLELTKVFARFYHNCPVLRAEPRSLALSRLRLCLATGRVLRRGLTLLTVDAPERM